ncbi:hypothetical protein NDU88_006831 [Pleurodeles waltl]|uniref:Uncharacterized protein n=1 Tax=Pleurodeles waltl TaxID=8319 RepID=A0AAV7N0E6_PLEWA|nr:hypothetical protein NDU88_006830 [Pleurodeles waltl]KAJ1109471.1 hypothetical protein NDU88_006831 [Pleurodeles waltl]
MKNLAVEYTTHLLKPELVLTPDAIADAKREASHELSRPLAHRELRVSHKLIGYCCSFFSSAWSAIWFKCGPPSRWLPRCEPRVSMAAAGYCGCLVGLICHLVPEWADGRWLPRCEPRVSTAAAGYRGCLFRHSAPHVDHPSLPISGVGTGQRMSLEPGRHDRAPRSHEES